MKYKDKASYGFSLRCSCCGVRLGGRAYIASGELNSQLTTKLTNIQRATFSKVNSILIVCVSQLDVLVNLVCESI